MENHTKDILQGQDEVVRLNQDIGSAKVDEDVSEREESAVCTDGVERSSPRAANRKGGDASRADYTYDEMDYNTSYTEANDTSSYTTQFAYASGASAYGANATTPLVSSITQGEGENAMNFAYTYDNRGNIISETRNGVTTTYEYDALGQLVRVNDPHENATWIYSYDCGGNILNKAKYAYTTEGELGEAIESIPYTYGDANWKDKLTAYNGIPIIYDAIGNPLNDGTWTYEWQAGRQLKSMTNAATGVTMEFTYNHAGIRTKKEKKVNGVLAETTEYILNGKIVVGLTHTDHASNEVDTMHFFYDAQGRVAQVDFNGAVYSYIYNLQSDVVGMVDNSGSLVVEYIYDAWGGVLSENDSVANTIGRRNPFMYRGYIWDRETGMYYLRSRYYVPTAHRFLNADSVQVLGNNLYIYTNNKPVYLADRDGLLPEFTDVNVYLQTEDIHWEIEIFGVIISHQNNSYSAKRPEEEVDKYKYTVLKITDVPREVAISGMDYLLNLCKPSIISVYKEKDSVYGYFDSMGWFNQKVPPVNDDAMYDRKKHPCAAIVEGAFAEMNISFNLVWGVPYTRCYSDEIRESNTSDYLYAYQFLKAYPELSNGCVISYLDAKSISEAG